MPNAKLILCPDANHGSWYQHHDPGRREDHRLAAPRGRWRPRGPVGTAEAADDQFRNSVDFLFEVVGGW